MLNRVLLQILIKVKCGIAPLFQVQMHLPGVEPGTFSLQTESTNHHTTHHCIILIQC